MKKIGWFFDGVATGMVTIAFAHIYKTISLKNILITLALYIFILLYNSIAFKEEKNE